MRRVVQSSSCPRGAAAPGGDGGEVISVALPIIAPHVGAEPELLPLSEECSVGRQQWILSSFTSVDPAEGRSR